MSACVCLCACMGVYAHACVRVCEVKKTGVKRNTFRVRARVK